MIPIRKFLTTFCSIATLAACSFAQTTPIPLSSSPQPATPTPYRPPTSTSLPLIPSATPEPRDTGWRFIAPGIEWRRLWTGANAEQERLSLVRLDPDQARLRVLYRPSTPRRVSQWAADLSTALVVVNAGFFDADNHVTGLIVSDGVPWGHSYDDFAGMLAMDNDGHVTLRWLRTWPFNPQETLAQAVQSFPVLVKPGGQMGFPPNADEGQRSRRTVVAQDISGRIVLLVSPGFRYSLHELAVWLTESDLELDVAMNLDGGTSTGLWIRDLENIDSASPIPAVIVIESTGQ
jgi:uncharacterized protein YigE (DUF2233 family)